MRLHFLPKDLAVTLVQIDAVEAVAAVDAFMSGIEDEEVFFVRFFAVADEIATFFLRGDENGPDAAAHAHTALQRLTVGVAVRDGEGMVVCTVDTVRFSGGKTRCGCGVGRAGVYVGPRARGMFVQGTHD